MKSTNLLLADNNLSYLDIARERLCLHKNETYSVDIATSSDECFEKLLEKHYHLVLLGNDIEGARSSEMLSRIVTSGFDIPVVMLVDEGDEDSGFDFVQNGAFAYFVKKRGHLDSLAEDVHQILKKHRDKKSGNKIEVFELKDPTFSSSQNSKNKNDYGYCVLNRKGKVININEKLKTKLNFQEKELFELNLEDLILPDDIHRYYKWLAALDSGYEAEAFHTYIIGKYGHNEPIEISIIPTRNINNEIMNYKGWIKFKSENTDTNSLTKSNGHFDQTRMIREMTNLIHFSYDSSLNHLLEKIVQTSCQLFRFKRATLALLDRRRKMFIKQIMVGYTNGSANGKNISEVPQNIIQKIFSNQYKVRVIYHNQEIQNDRSKPLSFEERRLQRRDDNNNWHPNNVVILNLTDQHRKTFGYISLDEPARQVAPSRETFHNFELFSDLTAIAIENFYRYSSIEKRNRRLKRLLVTGNIFKLDMPGGEILRESAWAIKFSLNFRLVILGLIKFQNNQLAIKSVACDDRIKSVQLNELFIPIEQIQTVLRNEYRTGKSYFVNKPEPALRKIKDIYYDTKTEHDDPRLWQWWKLLIIPIYEKHHKIIGFIMVDDPDDCLVPTREVIQTLEIFSNQLSIAIENRGMYLHLKNKLRKTKKGDLDPSAVDSTEGSLKKIVDIFCK